MVKRAKPPAEDQLSITDALRWFVPEIPAALAGDERRAHLFADHRQQLGYRLARCGVRHRLWTAVEHLPDGDRIPRCADCLTFG